ncbi:MAG: queuosine precursor transporter [Alphaproteobacteria bacterium]|nr:queuosine precursor transporter [Alphaproteobacteria bacterium]
MMFRKANLLSFMTSLYVGFLIMGVLGGAKLVQIGALQFDGGLILYSMCFLITDIVTEVYGKKNAIRIVVTGFYALLVSFLALQIVSVLPASQEWSMQQEFETVFGLGSRVMLAAIFAFLVSQYIDLSIFSGLLKKTNGKYLWLRNNVSSVIANSIGNVVFSLIAFYGVYPVLPIVSSAVIASVLLSLMDTPLVYLGVWILKFKGRITTKATQLQ